MNELARVAIANLLEGAQKGHDRMARAIHLALKRVEVNEFHTRFPADFGRRRRRNDAACRFHFGKRGLDIEPLLDGILVAEDASHVLRAELVPEQPTVYNVCTH